MCTSAERFHSRSPRRGLLDSVRGLLFDASSRVVEKPKPEEKMHRWAEKSGQSDATRVKELMDTMQIADFEKYKMVAVFKCPQGKVAEKIRTEFVAKKFPEEVINAVIEGMGRLTFYEKIDSHFEHTSKSSERGKSNLYQYAVWCKLDTDGLMEVSVWCITTNFKKGSTGNATKNEIEGLKQFMEQETRADVLQIAARPRSQAISDHPSQSSTAQTTPEECMIAYARTMHASRNTESMHEDELINRMEITGFQKYRTNSSFKCPKEDVVSKVKSELGAKKFPTEVIEAVSVGIADMAFYKKMDENFMVHSHDGRSNLHKYAIWCSSDDGDQMEVSMMCIAASFKKKSDGPITKSEIEVLGQYLGQEACTDVLKVHAPEVLQ